MLRVSADPIRYCWHLLGYCQDLVPSHRIGTAQQMTLKERQHSTLSPRLGPLLSLTNNHKMAVIRSDHPCVELPTAYCKVPRCVVCVTGASV